MMAIDNRFLKFKGFHWQQLSSYQLLLLIVVSNVSFQFEKFDIKTLVIVTNRNLTLIIAMMITTNSNYGIG